MKRQQGYVSLLATVLVLLPFSLFIGDERSLHPFIHAENTGAIEINEDKCVQLFENFVAGENVASSGAELIPQDDEFGFPLPPWESVAYPFEVMTNSSVDRIVWYDKPTVRVFEDNEEIWFTGGDQTGNLPMSTPLIGTYSKEFDQWSTYSGYLASTELWVQDLFSLPDGSIWGIPNQIGRLSDLGSMNALSRFPLLARFNPVTGEFEQPLGIDTIPTTVVASRSDVNPIRTIAVDNDGMIWLFASPDGVYRYSPLNNSIEKALDLVGIRHVAVSPTGAFVFTGYSQESPPSLFEFSPSSYELREVSYPVEFERFVGYAFDAQGRLWLGASGYRSPDNQWHSIAPLGGAWRQDVGLDFVSSDGRLWYMASDEGSRSGRAWYSPDHQTGCQFSAYSFDAGGYVEDQSGSMWLTCGTRIYRLPPDS